MPPLCSPARGDMGSSVRGPVQPQTMYQNVVVMRHGERIDYIDQTWAATRKARKWDPELVRQGRVRAFSSGQKLRTHLAEVPINRAFVSPFLRCLETAAEVISALCATVDSDGDLANYAEARDGVIIDPSKIKVSVEYGLSHILNSTAIKPEMIPEDGKFSFDISQCESILPAGTIEHNVEPVYPELPKWGETEEESMARYVHTIKALADKYPSENLLLVTHSLGVFSALVDFTNGARTGDVGYCAYFHARRPIFFVENQSSFTAGAFQVVSRDGFIL